jgi:hypothetical protein
MDLNTVEWNHMFKLDNNFLTELGLGTLPAVEKNKMLAHIYETLEMRVGMKLAEQMSNEQLDEFESYINRQDEAGALKWLESNFPNYKQVVAQELEKLKGEISLVAPQIVAQAAQNVTQNPQPAVPQQQLQQSPSQPMQAQSPGQPQVPVQAQVVPQQYQPQPPPGPQYQPQPPPGPQYQPQPPQYQQPKTPIPAPITNYDRKQPL